MSTSYLAVLGGNLMACHAIRRLKECGHRVLVVDRDLDSPAKPFADVFVHQNFSDTATTRDSLSSFSLVGIMPLNDFAIGSAALISRERDLPGWNEFAEKCFRSKVTMKDAWHTAGLPTARYEVARLAHVLNGDWPDWDEWPCVVKPSFSGGGSRGVFVAYERGDVIRGLETLQSKYLDGELLFEQYLSGSEHTLEVLVTEGKPHLLSISDKENYPGSATVVQKLYFPGPIGHAHRRLLEPLVYAACEAMRLTDGTAHFEAMLCNGEPYLLEVGGRPGGGLNFHPICQLSTGYDYPGLLGAVLTGNCPDFFRKDACHLVWHYFPAGTGTLLGVSGFEDLRLNPRVVDAMLYEEVGKPRFDLHDDLARPGYVLVKGDSHESAKTHAAELVAKIRFETQPQAGSM